MDIVLREMNGRTIAHERNFNPRRVVRVVPKNEMIRKYIKHPRTHVGFLAEGSAEWPNDAFTKRRIADGDVTIEKKPAAREAKAGEHKQSAKKPEAKSET